MPPGLGELMRMRPRLKPRVRSVKIDIYKWNPLMPEYAGAAAVVIVLYLFLQITQWYILLFGMAVGFIVVHLMRPNPRK